MPAIQKEVVIELSEAEKQAILEGMDDFENDRFSDFEEFMKEFK